jgi:hypothetical protein
MKTLYDVVTLALFAGLAILFLQRSTEGAQDRIVSYLPAALACAGANWFGNHGNDLVAVLTLVAGIVYAFVVLKPIQRKL